LNEKIKILLLISIIVSIAIVAFIYAFFYLFKETVDYEKTVDYGVIHGEKIYLPLPRIRSDVLSVEQALAYRRSIRKYLDSPLSLMELSQLLWAAYGISDPVHGFKTTPSAGATYPLEIYIVVKTNGVKINETHYLKPGIYKYIPDQHALVLIKEGDYSKKLMEAALNQEWVGNAPVNIVITAVFERTTRVYGDRGIRYVYLEAGHAGQNVYLEATGLGLGCVVIGAFYDEYVAEILGLNQGEKPIYIIPVGRPLNPYRVSEEEIHQYILKQRGQSS